MESGDEKMRGRESGIFEARKKQFEQKVDEFVVLDRREKIILAVAAVLCGAVLCKIGCSEVSVMDKIGDRQMEVDQDLR